MDSELYYIYTSSLLVIILLLFSLKQKLNYFDKCYSYSGIIITIFFILSILFELKIFIFTCHVSLVIFIMILSFIIENKIIIITNLTIITMIVVSVIIRIIICIIRQFVPEFHFIRQQEIKHFFFLVI